MAFKTLLCFFLLLLPGYAEPAHLAPLSSQSRNKKVLEEISEPVALATDSGTLRVQTALYSRMKDRGSENEDRALALIQSEGALAVLSDGMGGVLNGKRSSSIATRALKRYFETHPLDNPNEADIQKRLKAAVEYARLAVQAWNSIQSSILTELSICLGKKGRPLKTIPGALVGLYKNNPFFDLMLDPSDPRDTWAQAVRDTQKSFRKLLRYQLRQELWKKLSIYEYVDSRKIRTWTSAYLNQSRYLLGTTLPLKEILLPLPHADLAALEQDFERRMQELRDCFKYIKEAALFASTTKDTPLILQQISGIYQTMEAMPKIFENYRFPYPLFSKEMWVEAKEFELKQLFQDLAAPSFSLEGFSGVSRALPGVIRKELFALIGHPLLEYVRQCLSGWTAFQEVLSRQILRDTKRHLQSGSTLALSEVLQTGPGRFFIATENIGDSRIYARVRYADGRKDVKRLTLDRPHPGLKIFDIVDYDAVHQTAYQFWTRELGSKLVPGVGYHEILEDSNGLVGAFPDSETTTSIAYFEGVESLTLILMSDPFQANQDPNTPLEQEIERVEALLSRPESRAVGIPKAMVKALVHKKKTNPNAYHNDDATVQTVTLKGESLSPGPGGTAASA